MKFETEVVHAGHRIDPATGSVAPPIYLSTTFARDPEGTPLGGHTYIRESNPAQEQLEEALAPLEGGEGALVFASGMAAGVALLQTLPPGSHAIFPDDAYYGFRIAAEEYLPNWGIRSDFVAMEDLAALAAAVRPETRLVWLESPSNPLLKVVDLAGAADVARRAGALSVVDNTFATPALQRPLALGADVVMHSTTKYFGGHSDVQGGALIFARRDETYEKVRHLQHVLGAVASPFNCWLVLRGCGPWRAGSRCRARTLLPWPARSKPARVPRRCIIPGCLRMKGTRSRAARCPRSAPCSPSAPRADARRRSQRWRGRGCSPGPHRWAASRV
jgi:cystathionine gamma-synthase